MKKFKLFRKLCFSFISLASFILLANAPVQSSSFNSPLFQNRTVKKSFQTNLRKGRKIKKKVNQTKLKSVPPGNWGARGIGIAVQENGVNIEYDCADGRIEQKLSIDEKGNFKAPGVHIQGSPGPISEDAPPKQQPARYEGKISGSTMKLKVVLTETNELIGEFVLEKDRFARIHRCL